jgi:integrase
MMTRTLLRKGFLLMAITAYQQDGKTFYRLDVRVRLSDGRLKRIIRTGIPSKDLAVRTQDKLKRDAYEGKLENKIKPLTVAEAWSFYRPHAKLTKRSFSSDEHRVKHLQRHLSKKPVDSLTHADIDHYRAERFDEKTWCKKTPSVAQVNREIALLKRIVSYCHASGKCGKNALAGVRALDENNVRRVVPDEATFQTVYKLAGPELKPVLVLLWDSGMRTGEAVALTWSAVNLRAGTISLRAEDTKTRSPRTIVLTERAKKELKTLKGDTVQNLDGRVFSLNVLQVRHQWTRIRKKAGCPGLWLHDLRRGFATRARRAGIPESVVMRMTGHKTRQVFARYNIVDDSDVRAGVLKLDRADKVERKWISKGEQSRVATTS